MKRWIILAGTITGLVGSASAQVVYTGSVYNQNFDGLSAGPPTNTDIAWTDNSTLLGWYSSRVNYRVHTGSGNAGALYSFGIAEGDPDRALGSIASGTTTTIRFGARFQNGMGVDADAFTLRYTGEQWRNGGNTTQHALAFEYSLDATSLTTGTWTAFTALDFTGPIATSSAGALNGNDGPNRVNLLDTVILGSNWQDGTDLWIRWSDPDNAGNDHGLAIDDLAFSAQAVPEPATLAALGLGALALIRRKRK